MSPPLLHGKYYMYELALLVSRRYHDTKNMKFDEDHASEI